MTSVLRSCLACALGLVVLAPAASAQRRTRPSTAPTAPTRVASLRASLPPERASDDLLPRARTGSVLIKGATVITVSHGTLANTDVLVTNGRIAQIGRGHRRAARGHGR